MRGDGSLGYWYHNTSHFPSHCRNDNSENFKEEGLKMSLGDEKHVYMSLETSHCFSSNHGGHGHFDNGKGNGWYYDTNILNLH